MLLSYFRSLSLLHAFSLSLTHIYTHPLHTPHISSKVSLYMSDYNELQYTVYNSGSIYPTLCRGDLHADIWNGIAYFFAQVDQWPDSSLATACYFLCIVLQNGICSISGGWSCCIQRILCSLGTSSLLLSSQSTALLFILKNKIKS